MRAAIAVDFGTANTTLAKWDPVRQQGVSINLAGLSKPAQSQEEPPSLIPSLVHYGSSDTRLFGNEVLERNLAESPRTFQWMKRFIRTRSPVKRQIDSKHVSHREAGEAFLKNVFARLKSELEIDETDKVVFTVPVEAFEDYENWLFEIAESSGLKGLRLIDEPSAASLAYSTRLFPDESYLVFDFGAGSVNISVVRQEASNEGREQRCRVLGKAGLDLGGNEIDQWLFEEMASINGYATDDAAIREISRQLLSECRLLKERLSFQEECKLTVMNPKSGAVFSTDYKRSQLEALIESRNGFAAIDRTLRRALKDAYDRGFDEESIKAVLLVGGGSLMPSIQSMFKRIFGSEKVKLDRPLDAIARGGAAFSAEDGLSDFLHHSYAVKYGNNGCNEDGYSALVKRGTFYPSEVLPKLTLKAVFDGQDEFKMQIYQLSETKSTGNSILELIFDENGLVRLKGIDSAELAQRRIFCINEGKPALLKAEAPAAEGEERFELAFSIDANGRLLMTSKDLKRQRIIQKDFPLIKLS